MMGRTLAANAVHELPAVLDELAPRVSLGAGDGELGLKLGVNRLVVEGNGVGVLVWLASGVGERMDRGGHQAGHHPVRGRAPNGWRPVGSPGGHHADAKAASGWLTN